MKTTPDSETLPKHVGVIMDGNRRWAKARGLKRLEGHLRGYQNMRDLAFYTLLERKIPYLSAYVFSTENWSRTAEEVGYLMKLVLRALTEYLDEFHQKNIRVLVLGSREKLGKDIIKAIEAAEQKTKSNSGGTLALCFNYGGQQEIVDAARTLIEQKIDSTNVNIETFAQALYHPEVPPVDLVIRTSGEQRTSGYMLWRSTYSELLFIDKFWPDFSPADIDYSLDEYTKRQRRYGA